MKNILYFLDRILLLFIRNKKKETLEQKREMHTFYLEQHATRSTFQR